MMRLYWGCPDSELQAVMDDLALCDRQLAAHRARATYFPAEGMWMVFRDLRAVTGFCHSKRGATDAALAILERGAR